MADRQFVHKQNEVELARIIRESRPWFEKYGTTLIYAIAAVLAITALVVYLARRPSASAEASSRVMLAATAEDYQALADEFPDTPLGINSKLKQAEITLNSAIGDLFSNREVGLTELKAAETAFDALAGRSDLSSSLRLRVLHGQARTAEARCDGTDKSIESAVAAWKKVLDHDPNSTMFKELAEDRIRKLSLESTKSFYAWFQKQDPKPSDEPLLPQDGMGIVPDAPKKSDLDNLIDPFANPATPEPVKTPTTDSTIPPADPAAPEPPMSETATADSPASDSPPVGTPPSDPAAATPAEAPATSAPATDSPTTETPSPNPPEKSGE